MPTRVSDLREEACDTLDLATARISRHRDLLHAGGVVLCSDARTNLVPLRDRRRASCSSARDRPMQKRSLNLARMGSAQKNSSCVAARYP
jgi:hypothetical protein